MRKSLPRDSFQRHGGRFSMAFSSVQSLCLHLISSAFRRCRFSEQICRLSIILSRSSSSMKPSVPISISDTGIGGCLEDFQDLKFSFEGVAENWDGILSIKTTSICDTEIYSYQLNLKETDSTGRINKLPSNTKNGAKFSGTEVCLSSRVSLDLLLAEIHSFLQKMMILQTPNVAIHLAAEDCDVPGSRYEKVFLANEYKQLALAASSLERLKSGLEDYVLKHENSLDEKCNSCFLSREHLKVGSGIACCIDDRLHTELVTEAVIVISDISKQKTTCVRESGDKTEVLYFKDFSPGTISHSSMKALKSIDWRRYGLNLVRIVQQGGCAILEWGNLLRDVHIDIVLHFYQRPYPAMDTMIPASRKKPQLDRILLKRAVKLSLDDIKDKHAGVLLSAQALKISTYAPDLAKTIAGLILSSNDSDFQGECSSLLGLQPEGVGTEIVQNRIRERLVSVIEMNDKRPQKTKEAPFLFVDDRMHEGYFQEYDCEEVSEVGHLYEELLD
ncbi:hypothetical protein L6164_020640 [Bauhinia variegata]|uniref:Uncharacterized protein n=1 Tax=Bauhinia variegata TaxID=167791 RepID=A0ACB9MVP1_BAUVA|nr:hypothetical protein L6164_020640 [Bauhinia variegata]